MPNNRRNFIAIIHRWRKKVKRMKESIKIEHESQERLRVAGKIVTVEAGQIINKEDLSDRELVETLKFIRDTASRHLKSSLIAVK